MADETARAVHKSPRPAAFSGYAVGPGRVNLFSRILIIFSIKSYSFNELGKLIREPGERRRGSGWGDRIK
jgi:hypothetical protein